MVAALAGLALAGLALAGLKLAGFALAGRPARHVPRSSFAESGRADNFLASAGCCACTVISRGRALAGRHFLPFFPFSPER